MPIDHLPELRLLLEAAIEKYDLVDIRDGILAAAEPCLLLYGDDEAEGPVGGSRFGGLPDLPDSAEWPGDGGKLLPFVAQIDLSALPRFEGSPLPAGGRFYVFGTWHNDARAFFHDGPVEGLARREVDADRIKADWSGEQVYTPVPIVGAALAVSLSYEGVCRSVGFLPEEGDEDAEYDEDADYHELPADHADRLHDLIGSLNPSDFYDSRLGDVAGQLLGLPNFPGASAGDGGEHKDWINLLEIQSVGSMLWSDCGMLNIYIRRPDLDRRDFSKIHAEVNSG